MERNDYTYRHDLDLLKGFAILAVVLYHAGYCKSGTVAVFTPEHQYISYDGKHLTPSGARYYATRLNTEEIIKKQ